MPLIKRLIDNFEEEQYQDDQNDYVEDYLCPLFYHVDNYLDLGYEEPYLEELDTNILMEELPC